MRSCPQCQTPLNSNLTRNRVLEQLASKTPPPAEVGTCTQSTSGGELSREEVPAESPEELFEAIEAGRIRLMEQLQ